MLSLEALNEIKLVYLTCLALDHGNYTDFQKSLELDLFGVNQGPHFKEFYSIIQRIFSIFNRQILVKLRMDFTFADSEARKKEWNDRKDIVRVMLSILQQLSFSTESFLEFPYKCEREISPRTYIRIMSDLIEDIEMDFEAGAHKTFLRLQYLSESYDGEIPTQEPLQQKIFTLVNLFHFYSLHIIYFDPTSLNLDICTPKFLACLSMSSNAAIGWESMFASFITDRFISAEKDRLFGYYIFPSSKNIN